MKLELGWQMLLLTLATMGLSAPSWAQDGSEGEASDEAPSGDEGEAADEADEVDEPEAAGSEAEPEESEAEPEESEAEPEPAGEAQEVWLWGPPDGVGGRDRAREMVEAALDRDAPEVNYRLAEWLRDIPFSITGDDRVVEIPCVAEPLGLELAQGVSSEVGALVKQGLVLVDELEYQTALEQLEDGIRRLPCNDDFVTHDEQWDLYLYAGIAAYYAGALDQAAGHFYQAASTNRTRRWDPTFPPEPQTAFLDAVQDAISRPQVRIAGDLAGTGYSQFAIDGTLIDVERPFELSLAPGVHLLQGFQDGEWDKWLLQIPEAGEVYAIAGAGLISAALAGPGTEVRDLVMESLAGPAGDHNADTIYLSVLPSDATGVNPRVYEIQFSRDRWELLLGQEPVQRIVTVATDLAVEDCGDGEDNDGDDLIDCRDPDCRDDRGCLLTRAADYRGDVAIRFRYLSLGAATERSTYIGGDINISVRFVAGLTLDLHLIANVSLEDMQSGGTLLPEFMGGLKYRFLQGVFQPHIGVAADLLFLSRGEVAAQDARNPSAQVFVTPGIVGLGGADFELADGFQISIVGGGGWQTGALQNAVDGSYAGPYAFVSVGIGRFDAKR